MKIMKIGDHITSRLMIDYGNFVVHPDERGVIKDIVEANNRIYYFVKWDKRKERSYVVSHGEWIVPYYSHVPEELFEI